MLLELEARSADVLTESVKMLAPRLREPGVEVRTPQPLPAVQVDRAIIGKVFKNLISNALKYNDKPDKMVEVGWVAGAEIEPDPTPGFLCERQRHRHSAAASRNDFSHLQTAARTR